MFNGGTSDEIQWRVNRSGRYLTGENDNSEDMDLTDFQELVEAIVFSSANAVRMEDALTNRSNRAAKSVYFMDRLLIRTSVLCCRGAALEQARILSAIYLRKQPSRGARAWHAYLYDLAEAVGPKDLVMHYLRLANNIRYTEDGGIAKLVADLAHLVKCISAGQRRVFNGLLPQGEERWKELGVFEIMSSLNAEHTDSEACRRVR